MQAHSIYFLELDPRFLYWRLRAFFGGRNSNACVANVTVSLSEKRRTLSQDLVLEVSLRDKAQ